MRSHSIRSSQFLKLSYSAGGHPVTRAISQPCGAVLALMAYRLSLSPNQLTIGAAACSILGALLYAVSGESMSATLLCLGLLQIGYALDCADGQLARATGRSSELGRWLDVYMDMLTILSLVFAVLYRLVTANPEAVGLIAGICLIYGFSRVSDLFTCTLARSVRKTGSSAKTKASLVRQIFLIIIDTPIVLLCIVLLREHPGWLVFYLALIGSLFIVHGLYVGLRQSSSVPS